MPNINAEAHELDRLFCTRASADRIQNFFCNARNDLIEIFSRMICRNCLFSPEFIAAAENCWVKKICIFLNRKAVTGYDAKMHICAAIIMSEWIAADKRAMFWHVLKNITWPVLPAAVQQDIDCARKTFLYHIMPGEKSDFLQRTTIGTVIFEGSDGIMAGIRGDSVSDFEANRQASGENISPAMLLYLLQSGAVKCFLNLLEHFPKRVFACRTAEEWLFTVCHDAAAATAVPVILRLEKMKPGIIARARDPWGNTLLWHTLARDGAEAIQRTLIFNGCDADAANPWGLSWRLVRKNAL